MLTQVVNPMDRMTIALSHSFESSYWWAKLLLTWIIFGRIDIPLNINCTESAVDLKSKYLSNDREKKVILIIL